MRASIDIGTNTALLLVGHLQDGNLEVLEEQQRVPRLGQGVDESRNLTQKATGRVIEALQEYNKIIRRKYPDVDVIMATATSAVRDANNRNQFLEQVKNETGINIRVLSGFEEAQYTFWGAQTVLDKDIENCQKVVIDIGGGSTEVATGGEQIRDRYSFDMGCIRFTERYLKDDPPAEKQLSNCRKAISDMLESYEFNFVDSSILVGVSGTVTSLAYIDQQCERYDNDRINGYTFSLKKLQRYISKIKQWPASKLVEQYPVVMEGRADIFLAGLLILEGFMIKYGFAKLIASTGGIRHGVLLDP